MAGVGSTTAGVDGERSALPLWAGPRECWGGVVVSGACASFLGGLPGFSVPVAFTFLLFGCQCFSWLQVPSLPRPCLALAFHGRLHAAGDVGGGLGLFSSLALVVAAVFRFHGPFPVFLCLPCLLFVS